MKLSDLNISSAEKAKRRMIGSRVEFKNTICLRFTKAGLYFNVYTGDLLDCDWIDFHIDISKKLLAIVPAASKEYGYKFRNYCIDRKVYRLAKGISFNIYETIMNENYKPGGYCIGEMLEDKKGLLFDLNKIIQLSNKDRG